MILIEPLKRLLIGGKAIECEDSEEHFGGFCDCGGTMKQKFWAFNGEKEVMISECEKCWNVSAFVFEGRRFLAKEDVSVVTKKNLLDFARRVLSNAEFEAFLRKLEGKVYNPTALSRARKRMEELGIRLEDFLEIFR
ncbi:MAG: hypothetical protein ABWW66_03510 [Archaeoglobaceae archaeon]